MDNFSKTKKGFTLVEVLVSVGVILLFLPFALSMIINSQLMSSYAKHKIQAAYAAEQIIEAQRQNTFLVIAAGSSQTIGPGSVVLDTKGNYSNTNCSTNPNLFCGTATITVTPVVYTSTTNVKTTNTAVDHFVVTINWNEQIVKLKVPMTETYAEDVGNGSILN